MSIVSILSEELLMQSFADNHNESVILARGQQIAYGYSIVENSIAVLSDLKSDKSYIYHGGVAEELGIAGRGSIKKINSIWEDDIFSRTHPGDLTEKHLLERQYFHLLKSLPVNERTDYHIISKMRMVNSSGVYVAIQHRMFYVCSCPSGNLWLALCLYNFYNEKSVLELFDGVIANSATGAVIRPTSNMYGDILSSREKEVLKLIEKGKKSRDIADVLFISKNTVDRHRQNILLKLRVRNSFEACRIAKLMDLI